MNRFALLLMLLAVWVPARADLTDTPPTPKFTITVPPNAPPLSEYRLLCIEGTNKTAVYPEARIIQQGFTDNPHTVSAGVMADGLWSCYYEIFTAETPRQVIKSENRLYFRIGPPPPPPSYVLKIQ